MSTVVASKNIVCVGLQEDEYICGTYIPEELCHTITSFIPNNHHSLGLVCKSWNSHIKDILLTKINILNKWYKIYRLNSSRPAVTGYLDYKKLIRRYTIYYPTELFLIYPEFVVSKLGLPRHLLTLLPESQSRKRSHIRNWLTNLPINEFDLAYVGW